MAVEWTVRDASSTFVVSAMTLAVSCIRLTWSKIPSPVLAAVGRSAGDRRPFLDGSLGDGFILFHITRQRNTSLSCLFLRPVWPDGARGNADFALVFAFGWPKKSHWNWVEPRIVWKDEILPILLLILLYCVQFIFICSPLGCRANISPGFNPSRVKAQHLYQWAYQTIYIHMFNIHCSGRIKP